MDREHIDDGAVPAHARRREDRREPDSAAGAEHLPRAVGNAAFTQVVRSALGGGAAVGRAPSSTQGAGPVAPDIASEIEGARGGGAPLAEPVRAEMEGGLGADLSNVRVHTDSRADTLNRSVQAEAFTTGTDIFFRSGTYAPDSSGGRRLLAHELTHVVQQSNGQVEGGRVSHPDDAHEVEARSVAETVTSSPPVAAAASSVQREATDLEEEEEPVDASVSRQELEEEEEEEVPPA